jgi:adhesin transport system membrane fusion protein
MLKLQREVADLKGQIATAAQTIPRLESAITEAERQIEEQVLTFRQNARAELNQKAAELAVTTETMKSATDKVARSDLRAPVDGIVNRLHVTTVGGVVKAGEDLVEIVPLEDTLLVEARVRPADIAFIHPNQDAVVKITAYDFSIYGGLPGKVERISADTVFDEESRERFYTVTVRTDKASLGKGNVDLPIIPGMVASVDILTGKKSVLDYLLKPILKARYEALRER